MEKTEILIVVLIIAAAVAIVLFLVSGNRKDKKDLNPDAPDAVEESRMDHERESDPL